MKKLLFTFCCMVATFEAISQAPQRFSFQAVVRDANQNLIVSSSIGVKVAIHQNAADGTIVYEELFNPNPVTNANGLLTLEIGGGIAISGNFASINWGAGSYYLEAMIDPTGQTDYTLNTTSQLLSVPYALHAANAGGGDLPQGTQPGDLLQWNGTEWEILPLGQPYQQLTNCNGELRWAPYTPDVETLPTATNITPTSATLTIQVIDNGCSHANATVLVSTYADLVSSDPEIHINGYHSTPLEPGNYSFNITNLTPGETYYFRAYMNTGFGFDQGEVFSFQAVDYSPAELTIDTVEIYRTPYNQIYSGDSLPHFNFSGYLVGRIINMGVSDYVQTGFCWGYHPLPDFNDHVFAAGTVYNNLDFFGDYEYWGSYEYDRMRPNSDIYFRAYAINQGMDTSYSSNYIMIHTEGTEGNTGPSGGIIVLDKLQYSDGWRYLEIAPSDVSNGAPWGCNNSSLEGLLDYAIGTGPYNTTAITANCPGNTHAAALCANYALGGNSDWFLPSRHEGVAMLVTCNELDFVADLNGNYWTSSPDEFTTNISNTSCINYTDYNYINFCPQTDLLKVRPMRRY